jgi:hypothetical protein
MGTGEAEISALLALDNDLRASNEDHIARPA